MNFESIYASSGEFVGDHFLGAALLSATCFILVVGYYYNRNVYSYWKNKGVNGPEPWPLVGNTLQLLFNDRMILDKENVKKYGKVYGDYRGRKPCLVVADAEIIRQICIKDFDVFPNHEAPLFINEYQKNFLFFLQDEQWKKVRALTTPIFTSGKIKRMFSLLDKCADDLVDLFSEVLHRNKNAKAEIDAKEIYNLYAMDSISTCCYGLKMERAGSTNIKEAAIRNKFVALAENLFKFRIWRLITFIALPDWLKRSLGFRIVPNSYFYPFVEAVAKIVETRRKSTKKPDDYLQLLLDTKLSKTLDLGDMDLRENHHAGLTHEMLRQDQAKMVDDLNGNNLTKSDGSNLGDLTLDDLEILSCAMFLLVVGLETTSVLLSHASLALAFHPEIQQRLYEEIAKTAELSEDKSRHIFSYDAVTSNRYLDAVLSETLRRLSPIMAIDRISNADYYIEKYGIHLPKGSKVELGFYAAGNDPDYWSEPEKFDPERFMPENIEEIVPGSYSPFGIGPRHCIGMRFSLTEAKLGLSKLMMNFRFEPVSKSDWPPVSKRNMGVNKMRARVLILPRTKD